MSSGFNYTTELVKSKEVIGVTGYKGRLGSTLRKLDSSLVGLDGDITSDGFYNSMPRDITTIINCAAKTDVCEAECNPKESFNVNVFGPSRLASFCRYSQIKLVHISTDHVFGPMSKNKVASYTEEDVPIPDGVYAMTKYLGEQAILKVFTNHYPSPLIIRTSFMKEFALQRAFVDKYFSGDVIDTIAIEILKAVQIGGHGILHIGTGRKSIYDVARKLNPSVLPMYLADNRANKVGLLYINDTSLDSSKWEKIKANSVWT